LFFWAALACAGLFYEWPSQMFPAEPASLFVEAKWWALIVAAYVAIMLPFDILGGYVLPKLGKQPDAPFFKFWKQLMRGVLAHALIFFLSGVLIMEVGKLYGTWGVMGALVGYSLLLLLLQGPLARWLGNYQITASDTDSLRGKLGELITRQIAVVRSEDQVFAGGVTGLPWAEKTIVPAHWMEQMPEEQLRAQILRRVGVVRTRSRHRGVLLAMVWNLYGFWSASLFAGAGVDNVQGLFLTSMAFVVWMCFGQVVLCNFSKSGVVEADRYAAQNGISTEVLESALQQEIKWSRGGEADMGLVERMLSSSMPLKQRLESLQLDSIGVPGAWESVRLAQFLSWACLGWFSRADYAVCGQPQNWALQTNE
jgi:hypothetical protein